MRDTKERTRRIPYRENRSMRTPDDLSKLVNQSGFPLQLAVDRLVQDQADQLGWSVLYREHGWKHVDGQAGFIDLVVEDRHGSSVLVLECKRVLEADWLFLEPSPAATPTLNTRLWVTNSGNHGREHFGYFDALAKPESQESMYCVVAGQDAKSRPLLERLAAELTAATEALALEEHPIIARRGHGLRMYAPVVVTTARLYVSKFEPKDVALEAGEARSVSHREVQWVRFRKPLSSEFAVQPKDTDWRFSDLALAKEKQVFVVRATGLSSFLRRWDVIDNSLRALT
jgi:hypothetical protein